MKTYVGVEFYLQAFLTSALHGSEWSASRPNPFIHKERVPDTHLIGPRAGLDTVTKRRNPYLCRVLNSCRPARSLLSIMTEIPKPYLETSSAYSLCRTYCMTKKRKRMRIHQPNIIWT